MTTNVEKVLKMIKEPHHSTPAIYLALFPQPVEAFTKMKQELAEHQVVFELRGRDHEGGKQYDLYLVDKVTDTMVLVATNAQAQWLLERGFERV